MEGSPDTNYWSVIVTNSSCYCVGIRCCEDIRIALSDSKKLGTFIWQRYVQMNSAYSRSCISDGPFIEHNKYHGRLRNYVVIGSSCRSMGH